MEMVDNRRDLEDNRKDLEVRHMDSGEHRKDYHRVTAVRMDLRKD